MNRILCLLSALLFTTSVQALTPLAFYERPLFMSAWLPDRIDCTFDDQYGEGQCIAPDLPLVVEAVLVKLDGSGKHTIDYPTLGILKCTKGQCDDVTGVHFASLANPPGYTTTEPTTWIITENYYPVNNGDQVTAWRRGTGPLAQQYPEPMIYKEHRYTKEVNGQVTYEVWCNPKADVCDLAGNEITRAELPKYIPIHQTDACVMEFCYDDQQNVMGLNPDYFGPIGGKL